MNIKLPLKCWIQRTREPWEEGGAVKLTANDSLTREPQTEAAEHIELTVETEMFTVA